MAGEKQLYSRCAIILTAFVSPLVGSQLLAAEPSLAEVREGLAARSAAITNVSFRAVYHVQIRGTPGGSITQDAQSLDCTIGDEKYRADIAYKVTPWDRPDVRIKLRLLATIAQDGCRRLIREETNDQPLGVVEKSPRMPWSINPAELLSLNHWAPLRYLEAVPVLVDGTERLDGVETVRLGWSADEPDRPGAARRGLYWIAPGLGHAVIRTQSSRRPGAEMAWKVVEENRSEGFREYHGIWLPSKVHYSAFRYSNDGNTYELAHEIIASFESWIINQTLDAKTFRLEFPAGTLVTDLLNGGRTYIKGAISDPTIHDNLELARTQISNSDDLGEKLEEALAENPFGRATKHLWVICLLLTAFAGGGTGVYFFWMMRRKTRKQE